MITRSDTRFTLFYIDSSLFYLCRLVYDASSFSTQYIWLLSYIEGEDMSILWARHYYYHMSCSTRGGMPSSHQLVILLPPIGCFGPCLTWLFSAIIFGTTACYPTDYCRGTLDGLLQPICFSSCPPFVRPATVSLFYLPLVQLLYCCLRAAITFSSWGFYSYGIFTVSIFSLATISSMVRRLLFDYAISALSAPILEVFTTPASSVLATFCFCISTPAYSVSTSCCFRSTIHHTFALLPPVRISLLPCCCLQESVQLYLVR